MVVARPGAKRVELEDAHSHRLPAGVNPDDPAAMGDFIQQMLKKHRWHHRRVIVDVPRDKATINRLVLPPTPEKELAAAVRFQAMKELPFPLDDAEIDYVIMQRNDNGLVGEVLLAAVLKTTLNRLRETCVAAGLEPLRIGLRPYANLMSVQQFADTADKRVLFVDVGPTMTEIDIIRNGLLAFSRAANVNIPEPGPDVSLHEDSRMFTPADLARGDEAVSGAVADLLTEMSRTMQAYRATEPNAVIEHIMIAGGTGAEPQLLEAVEKRFGLSCGFFDPTVALGVPRSDAPKLRSFASSLGLAWGLRKASGFEIDFLNPKRPAPPGHDLRQRLRVGGLAAALVAIVLLGTGVTLYARKARALAALNSEIADLGRTLREKIAIDNRTQEIEEWAHWPVWSDYLLHVTKQAVEPGKKMLADGIDANGEQWSLKLRNTAFVDYTTFQEFRKNLDNLRLEDNKHVFWVPTPTWTGAKQPDAEFKGNSDITLMLRDPSVKWNDIKQERARARSRRLKEF